MRPVQAQPGYTTSDVLNLINSKKPFVYADCFTIETISGDFWYFTSAQQDLYVIPIDGSLISQRFRSDQIKVSGLKMKLEVGVTIDEQTLNISYKSTDTVMGSSVGWDGFTWGEAISNGMLDGATIRRDRFFAQNWFSPWIGGAPMFLGRVSTLDKAGRQDIQLKVKSYLVLADISMPRELMQPQCRNTLYDSRCKLVKTAHAVSGTVGAGSDNRTILWSGATADMALGTISVETGPSTGQSRTIQSVNPGVSLTLVFPLLFEPAAGDIFAAFPGCDKSTTRCTALGNLVNHTGMPFMPTPESAV